MLALEAPQVSRRRRWHPQALLGRRGAVPRLNGVERSAMLLLTVGLHVAVLGVMLWQRPAPEAVAEAPAPPATDWVIPTILPGGPRPSGGGGGQAGPSIPPKTILVPAAIAAIEAPAEAKPQVEAPIADAAPPEFGVIASDPGSEPGTAGPGTGDGSGGDGDRGRGPGGDGDGGPGPGGGGAAATEQVRILSGDMEPPRLVERVEPEVPLSLRRPPRDAKVKLRCIIERDGSVRVLNVLSDPARVQREAVDAVERWRYEPARSDGRPISVYLTVEVSFRMR